MPRARHGAGQRRSHRRQERTRRPSRSCACRCGNGCCGSRPTPTGWTTTSNALDWSEGIKALQRNWIGRSTGAEVDFYIGWRASVARRSTPGNRAAQAAGFPRKSRTTTCSASTPRAPTRSSARPTWSSRRSIRSSNSSPRRSSRPRSKPIAKRPPRKSDLDRTELAKEKTGVFTGAYAINPVNGRAVPDLDRRLRAHQLRHRRDHGRARARRARLRVRPAVRPRRSCRRRSGRRDRRRRRATEVLGRQDACFVRRAASAINSGTLQRPANAEFKQTDHRRPRTPAASAARP